ncbi:MAG: hypothetical protein CSA26_09930 [Desulfobacterales bacterium]|nr:MAG: hypothetical protein CSA26_09930 [Desulfobacterales bacterium]
MVLSEKRCYVLHFFKFLSLPLCLLFVLVFYANAQDLDGLQAFKKPGPGLHAVLGKAEELAEKEKYSEAMSVLETYAAAHPSETHPLLYYEQGYFAYKAGNLQNAISSLKKSVAIAPEFRDGWQLLSLAWQESGSGWSKEKKEERPKRLQAMQNSAVAMEKVVQLKTDDDLLYQSAMLWLEAEKPKRALTILEALSKKDSPKEEWLVGLSEALKALKNSEEMAESMEKAARINNNPELLFHAAYLWADLEKPKRALPLLEILANKKKVEKNWLLLLASVYNTLNQFMNAAMTFERVIEIDPAPDYLYSCGVLWLQAEKPDKALHSLLRLKEVVPPKADWFVATAQAWLVKEKIEEAADAMEKAASISGNPQHIYQAGALRLQLKQADRAIALLTPLADHKKPESKWLVALSNAWLLKENYVKGATYMERAAYISGESKLFYRAGMLWRVEEQLEKTIKLLRKSVAGKKVEQLWLIDLASVLLDANREKEVAPVMKRTRLADKTVSNQLRYRGAVIWLNLQQPENAYPLLKILGNTETPKYAWLSSLVKTCVELDKVKEARAVLNTTLSTYPSEVKSWKLAVWFALQQSEYVEAVAAKEVVLHFEPDQEKHLKDLSKLYLLAGVPQQSARYYKRMIKNNGTSEELKHLVDIYFSGRRYEQALPVALKMAELEKTAVNFESLGDIYYAMHRYDESCTAYEQAAALSDNKNAPDILMKAAYAAMKKRQYERAAVNFNKVINSGMSEDDQVQFAMQNLAYIERIKEQHIAQ